MHVVQKWDLFIAFDGRDPEGKGYEHHRRDTRPDTLRNESIYIALCAKICKSLVIPYAVVPDEADFQAVMTRRSEPNVTVVTGDSDIIAYGSIRTIIVRLWAPFNEVYQVFDLLMVSDEAAVAFPLIAAYRVFGTIVFHAWAAIKCCDFTKQEASGAPNLGTKTFLEAIVDVVEHAAAPELFVAQLAESLINHKHRGVTLTQQELEQRLTQMHEQYSRGIFYDDAGNKRVGSNSEMHHASVLTDYLLRTCMETLIPKCGSLLHLGSSQQLMDTCLPTRSTIQ